MCPLVSAPNRGYADYQRTGNWDSGTLWSVQTVLGNVETVSPISDVSRFAYLGGQMSELTSQSAVTIIWYADAVGTREVGRRRFQVLAGIGSVAQVHLPNLGPFVKIVVDAIGGVNYQFTAYIFATNRVHPLEFIPIDPVLLDRQAANLAAGSTDSIFPLDYYAGPVSIWHSPQYATGLLRMLYLNTAGNWDILRQVATGSSSDINVTWVTPTGAWRVDVNNSSGAANTYYLTITPSTTGAT